MSWSGYRNSKLGDSLAEALDAFITEGKLEPDQANVIMSQFDKSTAKYLDKSRIKAQLKGELHTYRSYDEVYTLLVKDCEIVLSGHGKHGQGPKAQAPAVTMRGDMVKLVCQDAKIGQRPQ